MEERKNTPVKKPLKTVRSVNNSRKERKRRKKNEFSYLKNELHKGPFPPPLQTEIEYTLSSGIINQLMQMRKKKIEDDSRGYLWRNSTNGFSFQIFEFEGFSRMHYFGSFFETVWRRKAF